MVYISKFWDWLTRSLRGSRRRILKFAVDAFLVALAYYLAYSIRFEGQIPTVEIIHFFQSVLLLVVMVTLCFYGTKLYKGLWEYSSIKDLLSLLIAHSVSWAGFITSTYLLRIHGIPRSVLVIYWLLALIFLGGVRFSYRLFREAIGIPVTNGKRVLVVGAGDAGEMIIRQMKSNRKLGYYPVGIADDDPDKRRVSIHGVPVLGRTEDIPKVVKERQAEEIIIATPSAKASQMRRIVEMCEQAGVEFKTVPGPREIMDGSVSLNQLRKVHIEDLLEREPVRTDAKKMAAFLQGQVVMVTGAGGSIGQELCRQILRFAPRHLVLYDHAENSLFYLEHELHTFAKNNFSTVVGDVTDVAKTSRVLEEYKPAIIFHAAAHKHVHLMELNPEEAIKNNLKGTMNMAYLSKTHGVEKFVLISTDKAVAPTSVMGASKRLAEIFVSYCAENGSTNFSIHSIFNGIYLDNQR